MPDAISNTPNTTQLAAERNISTGIAGLDAILAGGLAPGRLYLVEGEPGTGSSQLAKAPPTKSDHSQVSYYREPNPKELPAPVRRSATDAPVDGANIDDAKPRGRACERSTRPLDFVSTAKASSDPSASRATSFRSVQPDLPQC